MQMSIVVSGGTHLTRILKQIAIGLLLTAVLSLSLAGCSDNNRRIDTVHDSIVNLDLASVWAEFKPQFVYPYHDRGRDGGTPGLCHYWSKTLIFWL